MYLTSFLSGALFCHHLIATCFLEANTHAPFEGRSSETLFIINRVFNFLKKIHFFNFVSCILEAFKNNLALFFKAALLRRTIYFLFGEKNMFKEVFFSLTLKRITLAKLLFCGKILSGNDSFLFAEVSSRISLKFIIKMKFCWVICFSVNFVVRESISNLSRESGRHLVLTLGIVLFNTDYHSAQQYTSLAFSMVEIVTVLLQEFSIFRLNGEKKQI